MSLKVILDNTLIASDLTTTKTKPLKGDFVSTDEKMLDTGFTNNELINTILLAYCHHRMLVLSPDDIMMVLKHSVCNCINTYTSTTPNKLKLTNITSRRSSDWERIVDDVESSVIKSRPVGIDVSNILTPEFSTTTRDISISAKLTTLSTFKNYFSSEFTTQCGIPCVELRGTQDDWNLLRNKYETLKKLFNDFNQLNQYFLDMDVVLNVLILMRNLSPNGEANAPDRIKQFWTKVITRIPCDSGSRRYISGWSQCLIPTFSKKSMNNSSGDVPQREEMAVPSSLCECKVNCLNSTITFYSGFVGCQEREDGALYPVIGWFACEDDESICSPQDG